MTRKSTPQKKASRRRVGGLGEVDLSWLDNEPSLEEWRAVLVGEELAIPPYVRYGATKAAAAPALKGARGRPKNSSPRS